MHPAQVIAQIIGPMYVVIAIGILLKPQTYRKMFEDSFESPAMLYMWGFIALLFGLLILAFHPAWTADWKVIITIIGWAAVAKGSLLIVRPGVLVRFSRPFLAANILRYQGAVALLFGLFLAAKGVGVP